MRTGPPPSGERTRLPELEAMAGWFTEAMEEVGHGSIRRTAEMTGMSQRALYDVVNAERMLPLRTVRALAEGLGRDPEEVARLWAEAKRDRDRTEQAELRRQHPSPASWADIPLPSPALRDVLEAQDGILDCLPYSLLGLTEPTLSAVYVRQTIRRRAAAPPGDHAEGIPAAEPSAGREEDGGGHQTPPQAGSADPVPRPRTAWDAAPYTSATDPVISLPDALARHDHLLITGEAGAGKSTLASQLVRSLCGVWLRRSNIQDAPVEEPLLPLCLSASLLAAESGSWSERLRRAALSTLGGGLVADPPASLFGGRSQGARWLIFVDGLDEVADRRQRTELIRTLARHSRRDSDFRLVVTSRPLPPTELAPLQDAVPGTFEIQPLGQPELSDYARRWFDQQRERVQDPGAAADRFIREVVEEGELKELVGNPLLATLALVNSTLEPSRRQASSRLALYESFLERLRDRTAHGPAAFPAWLAGSADELVRALARLRTEGEEDLAGAARDWLRQRPAQREPLPPGWEGELPAALAGTGLLVVSGDQMRFLHLSFAEFLAALEYAHELPADGSGLEPWIRRACAGEQRSLALFVLCRWAARKDCSNQLLIDRLLASPGEHRALLAGSLMTEGVDLAPEAAAQVISRLVAMVRGDDEDDAESAVDTLSALNVRHDTAPLLQTLAEAAELPPTQRFLALSGLSRLVPAAVTESLLATQLELLYGLLPKAAQLATQLSEGAEQAVRERIDDFLQEPGSSAWTTSIAAAAYRSLGRTEDMERAARLALEDPLATAASIRRAAFAWLGSPAATRTVAEVAALGRARPAFDNAGRMAAARELERAGATDEAAELALAVLEADHPPFQLEAADLWLRIRGESEAGPVRRLLDLGREVGWEIWRQAHLLETMVDAGVECPVGQWTGDLLSGERQLPVAFMGVAKLWATDRGPTGTEDLYAMIGGGLRVHQYDRAEYAELLLEGGLADEAFGVAELALRGPDVRDVDARQATEVLLKAGRSRAVVVLAAQLQERPGSPTWGLGVLEALSDDGMPDLDELTLRIADHVLQLPGLEGTQVQDALGLLAVIGGNERLPQVVSCICTHPALSFWQQRVMALALASGGAEEAALVVWRHLLSPQGWASDATVLAALTDSAQALGFKRAAELVNEQLGAAPPPLHRSRLERMAVWLTGSSALS